MQLNTYLNFNGNCREAFDFYARHLNGAITMVMTHAQGPQPDAFGPEFRDAVMHARLALSGTELFGADMPPGRWEPMRSAYLTLRVPSNEEAERVYGALTQGGEIFMPLEETFFAHRFAMFRDRFGINWMLLHERLMS